MRKPGATLTPQELAIMKIVWDRGEATVRDVYERLRASRRVAYTTVLTMIGILEQKGYVRKSGGTRAYLYRPARPRQQVLSAMVREFVDRVFDGASAPLLLHLVEGARLSQKDRASLKRIISETEE